MRKIIFLFTIAVLCLSLSIPALGSVKINNKTGELLKLEIKSNNRTSHMSLAPGVTMLVGGPGETMITVRSKNNKALCVGRFKSGKKVTLKKTNNRYSMVLSNWSDLTPKIYTTPSKKKHKVKKSNKKN
ncbi:MAG: hypothetical protein K8T10_00450 [Candidatus Eremiobacteraeota bacterium]|nr:hypothetical protein [Candidatus Eremiobacteraeota bacterium]